MTIVNNPPLVTDSDELETRALIKEARKIRRKRQRITTLIVVIVLVGGLVAYNSMKSPNSVSPSSAQTLDSSHSPGGGNPADPRSEVMSITTVVYSVDSPPHTNNRLREALTLQTTMSSGGESC